MRAAVEMFAAVEAVLPPGHRSRRPDVPMVGRDAEVALFRNTMNSVVRHERALLGLLIGEAASPQVRNTLRSAIEDFDGVDVILDPIGGRSFLASYRMLAPLGRLIIFGLSAAAPGERRSLVTAFRAWWATPRFDPLSMINRNRGVFGLHVGHLWSERRQLAPLMDLLLSELSEARLTPIVARTFPLERAADAPRFIQSRQNIGKVVLTT